MFDTLKNIASIQLATKNAMATPIMPNACPNIIIPMIIVAVLINLLIKIYLLFYMPKNFEVKISMIELGTAVALII